MVFFNMLVALHCNVSQSELRPGDVNDLSMMLSSLDIILLQYFANIVSEMCPITATCIQHRLPCFTMPDGREGW